MRKKLLVTGLALLPFVFVAVLASIDIILPAPVRAASSYERVTERRTLHIPPSQEEEVCQCGEDLYNCQTSFGTHQEAQACFDYCRSLTGVDVHLLDRDNDGIACENLMSSSPTDILIGGETPTPTPLPTQPPAELPIPGVVTPEARPPTNNLIDNGDFEFGFYPVPQLGFEPPDIGNVPIGWNWYRSQTYGKYDIDNNEGFALVCGPNDPARNALAVYMQSTDQPDARLGVYQTVDVVPNVEYLFSISGTIQVQQGGSSPDINNRVELYFDHTGNTDWRAIPHEKWTQVPFREQELEFELSGPEDPDLAQVQDYYSVVKARSDKMTIFLTAWRRWPNWRTSIFTFDCVSLAPLNEVNVAPLAPELAGLSVTTVDQALEGGAAPGAQPAAVSEPAAPGGQPAAQPPVIPDAGGLPEKKNTMWITLASIFIISGLVGAGIWNIRRQK